MTVEYWDKKHTNDYSKKDWAYKPSIFAIQAVDYFPKSGRLLEIGTGQGGDADFFQSLGYKVVATDYSDAAITAARERVENVEFQNMDTSKELSFEDNSFDVVYSHMALHYFDKATAEKVFTDIHRILRPGGILAILANTVEDPDKDKHGNEKIEDDYYNDSKGLQKRYFSVQSMTAFTAELFEEVLSDNRGETYKDDIQTLIRFIGKKRG